MLGEAIAQGFDVEKSLYDMVAERLNWTYGYPAALINKSKYTVSELSRRHEKPERRPVGTEAASEGAQRGIVYHAIIEKIPLGTDWNWDIKRIADFAEDLVQREILSAEEIESVDLSKILHFLESPLGKRLLNGPGLPGGSFNLLMEGGKLSYKIIDCYFRKETNTFDRFQIRLFADKPENIAALKETYRPQLELYKKALEQIRGIRVDETYLYLFAVDRAVRL